MKRLVSIGLLASMLAAGTVYAGPPTEKKLIVSRIDATDVTKGLPLSAKQTLKSGDGRKKQLWKIDGLKIGSFEIIGNNQADADLVGWWCPQYDKDGNAVPPSAADSFCRRLFAQVLSKFVKNPEIIATNLTNASAKSKVTEGARIDDFSFETDGEFYSVRRWSRMKPR